ncbi:MAG: phosphotransferase [Haliea sp.]|nr:phosphotransferase [Haliea sp.]
MLQSLPPTVRLKLDQTLAQWPQWNCAPVVTRAPTIVKVLTAGISNYSVLVESEQHFVIRIDGFTPASFGLCRQTEWRALKDAYDAGLTPRPCYFNPDLGTLVSDYLPLDHAQELDVDDIARLLHRIHRLPPRHHRLNLADRILRYEKQLEHMDRTPGDELRQHGEKVSRLLEEISRHPGESVLCHNDLLRANRIYSGGKLWAIDWEYCAMASPWYDIAVIVNGDALNEHTTEALLHSYLGRAPNDWERGTLYRYGCVYRYLEVLWYMALEKPILDAPTIGQKLAELNSMLEKSAA